jgi:gamma-polyglutamate synthase
VRSLRNLVTEYLDAAQSGLWVKIEKRRNRELAKRFAATMPAAQQRDLLRPDASQTLLTILSAFLAREIVALEQQLGKLAEQYADYTRVIAAETDEDQRQRAMLRFLAALGAGRRQLRGDVIAMRRYLGADAVAERHDATRATAERELMSVIRNFGRIVRRHIVACDDAQKISAWVQADVERVLQSLLVYPREARIREAAFEALAHAGSGLGDLLPNALDKSTVQFAYRAALEIKQSIWLQCAALSFVAEVAPREVLELLSRRLQLPRTKDELFYRRRVVQVLVKCASVDSAALSLLATLLNDASPYVRQTIAENLTEIQRTAAVEWLPSLLRDECSAVVGQALCVLPALAEHPECQSLIIDELERLLPDLTDLYSCRVALHIIPDVFALLSQEWSGPEIRTLYERLVAICTAINVAHARPVARRWAAACRERLFLQRTQAIDRQNELRQLAEIPLGAAKTVPPTVTAAQDSAAIARSLAVVAENEFGFDIYRRHRVLRVIRDYRWGPRLWRVLHEFKRPSTDKRQHYNHIRGRLYRGDIHVPAGNVAELSETKIPGEPLYVSEEGGYRPYLPLVDQFLSALDKNNAAEPVQIVTQDGTTYILPPASLADRLKVKWRISKDFAQISRLRNWTSQSPFAENAYLSRMRGLGFQVWHAPHKDYAGLPYPENSNLQRFFAAFLPIGLTPKLLELQSFFYSAYQNTLGQLLVFLSGIALLAFGRHAWVHVMFRRARNSIPLSVGGWGTRGKSGTERLKAAVFNALGLRVVSKTTGCEAMFLAGYPFRPLREMFLFRPYDKATIWEQVNLVRLAAKLKAEVFLWECMALTPRYVRLMQQQWMRDDIATVTNCYPDHEDIQGPAGVDIPRVIGNFIPRRSIVVASEENMLPYLREAARDQQTEFHSINWLQAGLLTPDILERFPYQEHPYNIALVVRLFEEMGVSSEFSLKEMADRVIADLGVLKTYPAAQLEGRSIDFINGMSANERHGTLSNWTRMRMTDHTLDRDPENWICTVVNNRADRVARTQVFASIIVNDIGADRHHLIGGNLEGLVTFIRESFDQFVGQFDWADRSPDRVAAIRGQLRELASRWRVPITREQATGRLRAMLEKSGAAVPGSSTTDIPAHITQAMDAAGRSAYAAHIGTQWHQDEGEAREYAALDQAVEQGGGNLAELARAQLWKWLEARLDVVHDYYTTGNQLVHRVATRCPPGLRARVMGIQNIKGTGLDWVYRWQAWGQHHEYCQEMLGGDAVVALAAAQSLAASHELGLLDEHCIRDTITKVRTSRVAQSDVFQAELLRIEQALTTQIEVIQASLKQAAESANAPKKSGFREKLVVWAEKLLDSSDAVHRRRHSDSIYRELTSGRISLARAAKELGAMTKRQKGGWLRNALEGRSK